MIQLGNTKKKLHTFLVLIQFLLSSVCFENHVFIIRKSICTCGFVWYVFHAESYKPLILISVWKIYHTKLHVQMVFLMMNTWCSKHVVDLKNVIQNLILKCPFCLFTLHANILSNKLVSKHIYKTNTEFSRAMFRGSKLHWINYQN
jgi:hypothetical protein